MNFSKQQHLDLIRALAEAAGGRFRMLNNTIPAYRTANSDWVKLQSPGDIDAFKVEAAIKLPIQKIATQDDRLGAAAKVKDERLLRKVLGEVLNETDVDSLEPQQVVSFIKKALLESGAKIQFETFDEDLFKHLNKMSAVTVDRVMGAIAISAQKVYWPAHQSRQNLLADEIMNFQLDSAGVLHNKSVIKDAFLHASKEHYMRPDMFVIEVQAYLRAKNITLSLSGGFDTPDQLSPGVEMFLKDTLSLYSEKGAEAFDDAVIIIQAKYAPLGVEKRTITPTSGIAMLRSALQSEIPSNYPMVEDAGQDDASMRRTVQLAENIFLRGEVWQWRGVLNDIIEDSKDREFAKKVNAKWLTFETQNITIFTPPENVKSTINRIEKVYGNLLKRQCEPLMQEVEQRISQLSPFSSELYSSVSGIVDHFKSSIGKHPLNQYLLTKSLVDVLSPETMDSIVSDFKEKGVLPDVETAIGDIEIKKSGYRFTEEPSPVSRRRA